MGGEACDGGPACPSASFVGWDIPVDECEECIGPPGFLGGLGHGIEHQLPYDSFNECCDEACFTLPDLALGARRSPPQLDCPDCWGEPSDGGNFGRVGDDETMTESDTSVATPGDSVSPAQGVLKHSAFMGMDDRVIQEILECCCNEQDHPHQHHGTSESFHPFHAHQLPHSPADPLSSTSSNLNFFPSLPTVLAFPCKWSECNLSFATKDLLATHVNGDHLAPSLTPAHRNQSADAFAATDGLTDDSTAFARCLWDECASGGPAAASDLGPSHHGHPYGVHPRVATAVAPPPQPSSTGSHLCRWRSCDLSFETSAELMNHLSVEHVGSGKAGYVCEWEGCDRCDESKGFAQRQKVMRHLQTHTGDRPFVCDVCSKSFSEATTLTQHIRIHTQEKPYKCTHPGCEKAFALASALTIHLRTHSGSKPFLCPFPGCTSAFSESSNLSKHVRTHKGEKGYGCDECGKAFSRSDQLARHKKIHAKQRG
ncbi:hypothetical protein RQP46_000926 [Phenoliferia psychrophenolica]